MAKKRSRPEISQSAIGDFAEDLGRLLGTAENKARGWLDQRSSIASQLAQVRDKADELLRELTGGAANMASAVMKSPRGRPPASGKKTAKKRGRSFTAAQRKEAADRMRAYWAKRKKAAGKKKPADAKT